MLISGNPVLYLNTLRDVKNAQTIYPAGRLPLSEGKREFANFVRRNGGRSPKIVASVVDGRVLLPPGHDVEPLGAFLCKLAAGRYFCKPNIGHTGTGAFRLDIPTAGTMARDNEQYFAEIEKLLCTQDYLIQESLVPFQHPEIARFNGDVINTLRLITFDLEEGPVPVAAALRIAIDHRAVDNWSMGGVMVPIDLDSGVTDDAGTVRHDLSLIYAHPQSRVHFRDQPIPYLPEAVDLACRLHQKLALKSVGWDIALLQDGPCMLEANRRWALVVFPPQFIGTFLDFHLGRDMPAAIRCELAGSFVDRGLVRRWLCAVCGLSLASATVDRLSDDKLLFTLGGPASAIQSATEMIHRLAPRPPISKLYVSLSNEAPRPGLDVSATFSHPPSPMKEFGSP
jgi:Sugar-transfer associated ATP-grasp